MALGPEWQQKLEEPCFQIEEKRVGKFYQPSNTMLIG